MQKKIPMGKNPRGEKFLRGNIPAGIFPHGENQNVNIYLKHTQMCHTDCKSEPKLDFRPLNRCFKNPRGDFFSKNPCGEKSPRGKMKNCYYWWTFIFTHHKHEILSYLNKRLSFIIFENPRGEIFRTGKKSPRGW